MLLQIQYHYPYTSIKNQALRHERIRPGSLVNRMRKPVHFYARNPSERQLILSIWSTKTFYNNTIHHRATTITGVETVLHDANRNDSQITLKASLNMFCFQRHHACTWNNFSNITGHYEVCCHTKWNTCSVHATVTCWLSRKDIKEDFKNQDQLLKNSRIYKRCLYSRKLFLSSQPFTSPMVVPVLSITDKWTVKWAFSCCSRWNSYQCPTNKS